MNLQECGSEVTIAEAAADKGYHAAETIEMCEFLEVRSYIPEPHRPHGSKWTGKPDDHKRAVLNNRRRVRRAKSKKLQRRRSEVVERTFAHICETGGARRSWLRGLVNVSKHYLMAAAADDLGRLMRLLNGIGKPKCLQGDGGFAALRSFSPSCSASLGHAWPTGRTRWTNSFPKLEWDRDTLLAA